MSDRITIVAEPRTVTGKQVKQLRREGWIPGVVYGKTEPLNVQMQQRELRRALRVTGTTQLAVLDVNGDRRTVLVRDIQQHVTRRNLLHVDFLEVDLQTRIKAEAQLVSFGEAAPVTEGMGVATQVLHAVEIEALPDDLIAEIEVNMAWIETPDDVIYVGDLPVPAGVTILTDPETPVARFEYVQEEEEEEEELETILPAADEVEVIGKGGEEEEEEEEAFE